MKSLAREIYDKHLVNGQVKPRGLVARLSDIVKRLETVVLRHNAGVDDISNEWQSDMTEGWNTIIDCGVYSQ